MESIPTRLGPYEIQREIGRGGLGTVYLAREDETGRLVALKVLPTAWTNDPVRLKRFQREAETAMKVRHPNIVPIYSVGSDRGVRFIAMKYIEGTSLDLLLHSQSGAGSPDGTVLLNPPGPPAPLSDATVAGAPPAPVDTTSAVRPLSEPQWVYRAVRIVEKIARALGHLHEQGIVHRDVKPGNIIIDQRGGAWLADFGLVRDVDASTMSHMDGLLGTVQYIAPEQILGDRTRTDHRSDLYSLGVTLYELVTLRRPFDGRDPSSTLYAVAREAPVPPRKINPRLSDDLERVIQKAMAKDPDARYQTGNALADDLRRVRTFEPVRAARTPAFSRLWRFGARNPVLAAASLFVVLCFLAMAFYCLHREVSERRRLIECREEADFDFAQGRFDEAGEGYRVYLMLGGEDASVVDKLAVCRERSGGLAQNPVDQR
jgi:serine/threonine protein kinase